MKETAVGLFADSGVANAAASALRENGIKSENIRVVSATGSSGTNGATGDEFSSSFSKEIRTMGVSERESDAYLGGLRKGNVLVYATGTREEAAKAVDVMNEFSAIEIEEFAAAAAGAPRGGEALHTTDMGTINPESRLPESQVTIGAHEKSYTSHASRKKTEGARVFSW